MVVALVLAVVAGARSQHAWSSAQPRALGPYQGWVTLMSDPAALGHGVRVVLEVEGERFDATVYGSMRRRLVVRQSGERVEVVAERRLAEGPWARRARVRHVVGELAIERVGAWAPGTSMSIASNRLRSALRSAALDAMPADQAALFTGLVVGDDTRQTATMIEQFRTSGLSHLTAVSGQNVAYVLAVVGMGLRSLPRWWRLGATLAVIGWFVVLTRVEPSVAARRRDGGSVGAGLRARPRAHRHAHARARGDRPRADRSTAGVVGGVLVVRWRHVRRQHDRAPARAPAARSAWLVAPLSITLGAQAGVLLPTWLVLPPHAVVGVVANLLAVPVAGFVMLYGIPAGSVRGAVAPALDEVVMWPATVGHPLGVDGGRPRRRAEPQGRAVAAGWVVQLAVLAVVWRGHVRPCRTTGRRASRRRSSRVKFAATHVAI